MPKITLIFTNVWYKLTNLLGFTGQVKVTLESVSILFHMRPQVFIQLRLLMFTHIRGQVQGLGAQP